MECDCGAEALVGGEKCEECQIREDMGDVSTPWDFVPDLKKPGKKVSWENKPVRLYAFQCRKSGLIKIGVSSDVQQRKYKLEEESEGPLDLLVSVPAPSRNCERLFHHEMKRERANHHGEWYRPTPRIKALIAALRKGAPAPTV